MTEMPRSVGLIAIGVLTCVFMSGQPTAFGAQANSAALLHDGGPNGDVGNCVLPPGVWSVVYERDYANLVGTQVASSINAVRLDGDVTLAIACDGTTTILSGGGAEGFYESATEIGGVKQPATVLADQPIPYVLSNVHAARDAAGVPVITLQASLANSGGLWPSSETWTWRVTRNEGPEDPYELSGSGSWGPNSPASADPGSPAVKTAKGAGTYIRLDPQSVYVYSRPPNPNQAWDNWPKGDGGSDAFWHPAQPAFEDGARDGFTMSPIAGYPDVMLRPTLVSDFLAKVGPLQNTYTATVDWHSSKPKGVHFSLKGPDGSVLSETDGTADGNDYKADFEIGDLAAGVYSIAAEASSLIGLKVTKTTPLHIVETPHWATDVGEKPHSTEPACTPDTPPFGCEIYAGSTDITWPSGTPTLPQIEIPDSVPLFGGKWGLDPLKFHLPVNITSNGGHSEYGGVTGGGSVSFAHTTLSVSVISPNTGSRTRTTTADSGVSFVTGTGDGGNVQPSAARLQLPQFDPIHRQVDLLSLIPGAHYIYDIPFGVGKVIHATVPNFLEVELSLGLIGDAEFGLGADSDIALAGGHVGLKPAVQLSLGPDFKGAYAKLYGSVSGELDIALAPKPAVSDCELDYSYGLLIGFQAYQATVPDPITTHKLAGCTSDIATLQGLPSATEVAVLDASQGSASPVLNDAGDLLVAVANEADPSTPVQLAPKLLDRAGWTPQTVPAAPKPAKRPDARLETTLVRSATAFIAAPVVAAGPNGQIAVAWVGENPKLQRPQAFQIALRLFDGTSWSDAIAIGDGTAETATPSVAFDGNGHVVVAYMRNSAPAAGYDAVLTPHSYDGAEIAVALVDARTHAVTSKLLTANGVPDLNPELAATNDGGVWLGWESGDAEGNPLLEAAHWDGVVWGPTQAVAASPNLRRWDLAARDADTVTFSELLEDNSALQLASITYANGQWQAVKSVAAGLPKDAGAAVSYDASGQIITAWSTGDGVMSSIGDGTPQRLSATHLIPLAIQAGQDRTSLLLSGPYGVAQVSSESAADAGDKPRTVVRAFSSLTSIGAAPVVGGGWLVVRAPTSPVLGNDSTTVPQAADIILSLPQT